MKSLLLTLALVSAALAPISASADEPALDVIAIGSYELIATPGTLPRLAPVTALDCRSARLGLQLSVPLQGGALAGNVKLTRLARTLLEVLPENVIDFQSTANSLSFGAVDGDETVLRFQAAKNDFGRYMGYALYQHMQIGFTCVEN